LGKVFPHVFHFIFGVNIPRPLKLYLIANPCQFFLQFKEVLRMCFAEILKYPRSLAGSAV
jgi:hypothetical protein